MDITIYEMGEKNRLRKRENLSCNAISAMASANLRESLSEGDPIWSEQFGSLYTYIGQRLDLSAPGFSLQLILQRAES